MTIFSIKILLILFTIILLVGALFIYVRVKRQEKMVLAVGKSQVAASLNDEFASRGFFYSEKDDAFFSIPDAIQQHFGYCQLYDDTMPLLGMIVDCEPIPFEYDNKLFIIVFWKGQYGMALGCQVGIYCTSHSFIKAPGFQGTFYETPKQCDCSLISYTLKRKNKVFLKSRGQSCFLAGLRLGEFSNPCALSLKVSISFKNKKMLQAFINGLKAAGYTTREYCVMLRQVKVTFTKPLTTQPALRTRVHEAIIQKGNLANCNKYQKLTLAGANTMEKLSILLTKDEELYDKALKSFYAKELYSNYEFIRPVLEKRSLEIDKEE